MERTILKNRRFDEERALYHLQHGDVEGCDFSGPADGESVLKEARDIRLKDCRFSLRYPLWHVQGFSMDHSVMDEKTRAAIWYARDGKITRSELCGVKALRECGDVSLRDCRIVSPEFGWKCGGISLTDSTVESEYLFQQAIQGLLKDRTAVIIAHRLSTIRNADQILFVKDGHISEQGTHDELMQQKGDYYRFCTVQLMKN